MAKEKKQTLTMDKLIALCKGRGYIFAGSEIYGGLSNTWDYGPLGIELKNNVKRAWWKKFVQENQYNYGLDAAILMNPKVWEASGHLASFSDPLIDCKSCKARHRADNLVEDYFKRKKKKQDVTGWSENKLNKFIADEKIPCPICGKSDFTKIRKFNLMFKTFQGVTEDSLNTIYLRPETAQGIFTNYKNVQRTMRAKIPFGVAQVGKSFRNEITPGNFTFRTREFEQLELEFFCEPGSDLKWFAYWKKFCNDWLISLGIKKENLRLRDHGKAELSFYSKGTTDFEFLFPFGWGELWGVADRTDYDLSVHQKHSGENMEYFDAKTGKKYIPYVVEPSLGVDRMVLAFLCNAYDEEKENDNRVVLRLHPFLAPYKVAVLPLQKKLSDKADEVYKLLSKSFSTAYDLSGSIGKRYRRQDEIGTPFCVTVDFDTLDDNTVTLRDRDTMSQIRLPISEIKAYIEKTMEF